MARKPRFAPGGLVYHVLNRSAGRSILFRRDGDFEAFERLLVEAHRRVPLRLLSYCVMGNHWHFVTWPERDGQLTEFFRWLAHTHAMRWRVAHHTVGYGHLYQGRFKSFPVQIGRPPEHRLPVRGAQPADGGAGAAGAGLAVGQPVGQAARAGGAAVAAVALAGAGPRRLEPRRPGGVGGVRELSPDRQGAGADGAVPEAGPAAGGGAMGAADGGPPASGAHPPPRGPAQEAHLAAGEAGEAAAT